MPLDLRRKVHFSQNRNTESKCAEVNTYHCSCLVANLQMKVTWFGVESQVDSVPVVADDVFGAGILTVSSSHQLLQSDRRHRDVLVSI